MSRVLVNRPGAPRPAGPVSKSGSKGPAIDVDALRNLPATEAGVDVNLDPDAASSGRLNDETVTIVSAKFIKQDWKKKDGTYATRKDGSACIPEIQLEVGFKRDDMEEGKSYRESYRFGRTDFFAVSADGNKVIARPAAVKDGRAPTPRKNDPALLLLNSLKHAVTQDGAPVGRAISDAVNSPKGVSALIGLRVHVRRQRVTGMDEKAPDVLLIDFIEGISANTTATVPATTAPAAGPTVQAQASQSTPTAAAQPAIDIKALATDALIDVLNANNGSVGRNAIAVGVVKIKKWKTNASCPDILKTLKDEAFLAGSDKWILSDTEVVLV